MNNLGLISTGMITSNGANTNMVNASVKAGITSFKETQCFNHRGRPIRMANLPEGALLPLNEKLKSVALTSSSHAYMVQMASQAFLECLSAYKDLIKVPPALFMACPERTPGAVARLYDGFIKHLQIQSEFIFEPENSRQIFTGRAGGFHALAAAFKYLKDTGREFVLVGGCDSFKFCLQPLGILDNEDRLLVDDSPEGFIPADGAGFLLLASQDAIKKYELSPKLWLSHPGISHEPGHRYSNESYLGNGLSNAFKEALAQNSELQIDTIYSTLNGESFGSKELSVAMTRNNQRFSGDVKILHPADCFGDIGAAFGTVLIGLMSKAKTVQAWHTVLQICLIDQQCVHGIKNIYKG